MLANNPRRRKTIPDRVKLIVTLRELGLTIEQVNFDHHPMLEMRPIDEETGETIPPANDPDGIRLLLITDHKRKTFGPGGEKRITTAGGDIHALAHTRRLTKNQEEFRRRLLAKDSGEPVQRKSKWPKRPFRPKRPEPRP